MSNQFRVHDLVADNIYTQNIFGNISFNNVPNVSGNNFIYNSGGVDSVLTLTQNQYNQLTPISGVLYIIVE